MEYDNNTFVILVDRDDTPTGQSAKQKAHQEGLLHRAFSIFLFDSRNRLLIQRRHAGKYHSAGLWSNTCCSHPSPGEDTVSGARRRLMEEMGIECDISEIFIFHYEASLEDSGLVENEIDHVFIGFYDGPFSYDPVEIDDAQWVGRDELLSDMLRNPGNYTVWFRKIADRVWEYTADNAIKCREYMERT